MAGRTNSKKAEGPQAPGTKKGSLFGGHDGRAENIGFDWATIDSARIAELVCIVTGRGGAIRFGYTRDGGAGSIGLYYGDQRDTLYIRPSQDAEEVMGLIERTFENLPKIG